MTVKTVSGAFLKAAKILRETGWCRNRMGTKNHAHCAVGALRLAVGEEPSRAVIRGRQEYKTPITNKLLVPLSNYLGSPYIPTEGSITGWNDQMKGPQGKDAVIAAFRAVAKQHKGELINEVR